MDKFEFLNNIRNYKEHVREQQKCIYCQLFETDGFCQEKQAYVDSESICEMFES